MACSQCKHSYDLRCANVSIQRFNNTMTPNHKSTWKCMTCIETSNVIFFSDEPNSSTITECSVGNRSQNSSPGSPSEFMNCNDNTTIREKVRANVSTHNSFQSLPTEDEEDLTSLLDSQSKSGLNRSCPEINTILNVREELDFVKMELNDTQNKLLIAENEIKNLLVDKSNLEKQIMQYELKIEKITRVCTSTDLNDSKNNSILDSRPTSASTKELQKNNLRDKNFTSTPKFRRENTQSKQNNKTPVQVKKITGKQAQKNTVTRKICLMYKQHKQNIVYC